LRPGTREDGDDALVRHTGPLGCGQVLEQLVSRRDEVEGGHALGSAQENIGGIERYAQMPGLRLEDVPGKSSQRRSRGLGGVQDQLFVHSGTVTPATDIPVPPAGAGVRDTFVGVPRLGWL